MPRVLPAVFGFGAGSRTLTQRPQGRQFSGRHHREVDPTLSNALHQALSAAPRIGGALHGRQQIGGGIADQHAHLMGLPYLLSHFLEVVEELQGGAEPLGDQTAALAAPPHELDAVEPREELVGAAGGRLALHVRLRSAVHGVEHHQAVLRAAVIAPKVGLRWRTPIEVLDGGQQVMFAQRLEVRPEVGAPFDHEDDVGHHGGGTGNSAAGGDARPEGTEPAGRSVRAGARSSPFPALPPSLLDEGLAPAVPPLTATYLCGRVPDGRCGGDRVRRAAPEGNFSPPWQAVQIVEALVSS